MIRLRNLQRQATLGYEGEPHAVTQAFTREGNEMMRQRSEKDWKMPRCWLPRQRTGPLAKDADGLPKMGRVRRQMFP